MKLLTFPRFGRRRAAPVAPQLSADVALVATHFDEVAEPCDYDLLASASSSLAEQMHELINRNADGVNRAAIALRRETDLLLSLGISDPLAGKAGSYAQMALELANAGRGVNLNAEPYNLCPQDRAGLVARAMTLMMRAEALMAAAKKNNLANIQAALEKQEQFMRSARTVLVCSQE